jgi:hypothetical protein
VALGIVGMTLGVLRQRRKTRAALATDAAPITATTDAAQPKTAVPGRTTPTSGAAVPHPGMPATLPDPEVPGPVTAMAEAVLAKPAEPEVPGPVTAMAEAVLAEPDATPTRPFLAPGSHA